MAGASGRRASPASTRGRWCGLSTRWLRWPRSAAEWPRDGSRPGRRLFTVRW